nr:MAG TPA: hypothetical protein [Bacteriophage sp.]DAN23304.1 MAG TPA_asm: hypothetical protein [Bacteriophage sp.]
MMHLEHSLLYCRIVRLVHIQHIIIRLYCLMSQYLLQHLH